MTTLPQTTTGIQLPRPMGPGEMMVPSGSSAGHTTAISTHSGGSGAGQMTGTDVWRVLRSNMWLILISVVSSFFFGFALNKYLAVFHARYTATGYLQIQPGNSRAWTMFNRELDNGARDDSTSLVVEQRTQAQLLLTEGLFAEVLRNSNAAIRKTNWLARFTDSNQVDVAEAKEDLSKKFSAIPIGDSRLIAVSMTAVDPKDCQVIVTDLVNQHIENQRKASADKLLEMAEALTNRRAKDDSRSRTLRLETGKTAAELQLDGVGRPGGIGQKEQELQLLVIEQLKAKSRATEAQSGYDSVTQTIQQGQTPGAVEMMVNQNPIVFNLKLSIASIEAEIKASEKTGQKGVDYQRNVARRDALVDHLSELMAQDRISNTDAYLNQLKGAADAAKHDLQEITTQIAQVNQTLADMATKLADYLSKKDEEIVLRERISRTNEQLDSLNTAIQQMNMNVVSWMRQPETPDVPSFPRLYVTLSVCTALGLALSLGLAFLREMLDTSVRSPRDIARVGQMNLLGMIPHEDDDPQTAGVPLATVIWGAPTSMMAEQFRQVRTRLQHAASLDTTRSILVTSPGPGDGKSTVAANLAAGLALNGRRILLVDANFRRPELHRIFGVGNEAGFGNVLNSIENFESSVRQTKVPNLDLITTGPRPANATELLESQLLIDFIERALEEYDHVIFDSGPMLFVSETVALAPRVDGVVTVVRASTNSRGLLQRMRDALKQLKSEHLGVVLNGVRATGGGYYGRNIKTYYEYQNGHTEEAA